MNSCSSIRVQVHADVVTIREIDDYITRVPAYFVSDVQTVNEGHDVDMEAIVDNLNAQPGNWCGRDSGFVLERITRFVISITKYRPLQGSGPNCNAVHSYAQIHRQQKQHDVQNRDEFCFAWSVLAALYLPENNPNNVYSYSKYIDVLNLHGLQFLLQLKDISKFEWQNLNISVGRAEPLVHRGLFVSRSREGETCELDVIRG